MQKFNVFDSILGGLNVLLPIINELHYYISIDTSHDTLLCNTTSCCVGSFLWTTDIFQVCTLCRMMATLGNSKVIRRGIFFHIIQI
jgi:hypothetical protein